MRLEGRRIIVKSPSLNHRTETELMYRVDAFRRFIPNVGVTGLGLIQFYGPRAVRTTTYKKVRGQWRKKVSEWVADMPEGHLHTLDADRRLLKIRKK